MAFKLFVVIDMLSVDHPFFPGILTHTCHMKMVSIPKVGTQITKYLDWHAHWVASRAHILGILETSWSKLLQTEGICLIFVALLSSPLLGHLWVKGQESFCCSWLLFGSFHKIMCWHLLDVLRSPEGLSSISFEDKNVCYWEQKQWPPLHECGVSSTMSGNSKIRFLDCNRWLDLLQWSSGSSF